MLDSQGNLYGCAQGGSHGAGGIYKLAPPVQAGGTWTESALYNFGSQPNDPVASNGYCAITIDPATSRLFGTSYGGGTFGLGTIFELNPPAAGQTAWTESLIHSFSGTATDGQNPIAPPLKVGNTYYGGTTYGSFYAFTP